MRAVSRLAPTTTMLTAIWCIPILISVFTNTAVRARRCDGATSQIALTSDGTLYSAGYPEHYENADSCKWLLTTVSTSQVIQLETLDIDLEAQGRTCVDYIAAYDGADDQSPLLTKWCGNDKAIVQSTQRNLFLKFASSAVINRKGFAIAYRAITPYDLSCVAGATRDLSVRTTPVVYSFQMEQNNTNTCQWRFNAQGSQRLVLTAVKASGYLPCDKGYFALYDGVDTSAVEVHRWCGREADGDPFSAFYPTGPALLVMYLDWSKKNYYSFRLDLKAQTRPAQEICDASQMPVFELEKDGAPLFMAFPYATTAAGASCPVRFRATAFRVDVLAENSQVATCNSTAVSVYKGDTMNSSFSLDSECWRNTRTIFLSFSSDIITIAPEPGKTSVLQIIPQDYMCDGFEMLELTFRMGNTRERTIPRVSVGPDSRFRNYCIARFLFKAYKEEDHPMVHFEGRMEDRNGGDIITVYDGESIHDPVIYVINETDHFTQKWVVGSGQKMLVEFSADGLEDRGLVKLTSQSVPVTQMADLCYWDTIELKATSTPQDLSSVNYPGFFPTNFACHYKIRTETKGDVIHLDIVKVDLGTGCGDQLSIYSGDSVAHGKLGIVCGGNPNYATKFESRESTMFLTFISDIFPNQGDGWKVRYYSAPPTPEDDEEDEDNTAAIVGGVLGAVILILIIVIIYCAVTRRRTGNAVL